MGCLPQHTRQADVLAPAAPDLLLGPSVALPYPFRCTALRSTSNPGLEVLQEGIRRGYGEATEGIWCAGGGEVLK